MPASRASSLPRPRLSGPGSSRLDRWNLRLPRSGRPRAGAGRALHSPHMLAAAHALRGSAAPRTADTRHCLRAWRSRALARAARPPVFITHPEPSARGGAYSPACSPLAPGCRDNGGAWAPRSQGGGRGAAAGSSPVWSVGVAPRRGCGALSRGRATPLVSPSPKEVEPWHRPPGRAGHSARRRARHAASAVRSAAVRVPSRAPDGLQPGEERTPAPGGRVRKRRLFGEGQGLCHDWAAGTQASRSSRDAAAGRPRKPPLPSDGAGLASARAPRARRPRPQGPQPARRDSPRAALPRRFPAVLAPPRCAPDLGLPWAATRTGPAFTYF